MDNELLDSESDEIKKFMDTIMYYGKRCVGNGQWRLTATEIIKLDGRNLWTYGIVTIQLPLSATAI